MKPEKLLGQLIKAPDFLVLSGSRLYGTATPESDRDLRGFLVPPRVYKLGLYNKGGGRYNFENANFDDEKDIQVHSFEKWLKEVLKGSVTVTEILFAPEHKIKSLSCFGGEVLKHKNEFLSNNIFNSIRGYALGEKRRAFGETTGRLGEKRKVDIEEFGYSRKNAYHMVRLLRQGVELLREGTITFPRPNVSFLMEIRNGEYTAEQMMEIYEEWNHEVELALAVSVLPDKPNYERANELIEWSYDYAPEVE